MRNHFIIALFLLVFYPTSSGWAHPTSFEDGINLIFNHSKMKSSSSAIYSHKYWLGFELKQFRLNYKNQDTFWWGGKLNTLLKRFNGDDYQSNIYFMFGGFFQIDEEKFNEKPLLSYSAQFDYETRQIYSKAQFEYLYNKQGIDSKNYQVNLGFAPYLADYKELNTWLIFSVHLMTDGNEHWDFISKLRFFYRNVFWEIGANQNAHPVISLMVHL